MASITHAEDIDYQSIIPQGQTVEDIKQREKIIKDFYASEVIIMQYHKRICGKIKLTVGVLRGSRQKIQYCITAIEKTTNNPPRPGNSC